MLGRVVRLFASTNQLTNQPTPRNELEMVFASDSLSLAPAITCSCPSAAPEFEGRGGEALNLELACIVERMLAKAIDRQKLCLIEGEQCWVLNIDALVRVACCCCCCWCSLRTNLRE